MEVGRICQVKPIEDLKAISIRLAQKHPDLHLLSKIKQRLNTLSESVNLTAQTTLAIAVSLQGPAHLDGLQEKDPVFQAWKQASYELLCQEFGKENLVYLHLNQDKPIPAIHCIFVPIRSNQLLPQAFVGSLAHQQGYLARYQAVVNRLLEQSHSQAKSLLAKQEPLAYTGHQPKMHNCSIATNGFHEAIKSGLDRVKKEINLIHHAISMGYRLNKKKSCSSYAVLDQGPGTPKLLMPTRPNSQGNWFYKSLSDDQDKGTIVDFMLQRGYAYQEIVKLSNPILPIQGLDSQHNLPGQLKDQAIQQELAQNKLAKFPSNYGETYLEKRGIEPHVYKAIQGVKTNTQGAIFSLYDPVYIQGPSRLCSTIHYQLQANGSSDKYFQKGLPRGLSVLMPSVAIKELVVTESPIDALSHQQLHAAAHTLYVSTCGSIGQEIARSLEAVFLQAKEQSIGIKLCFDQDEAGKKMTEQVSAIASKQGMTCQVEWPSKGKDWNDMLVAHLKQSAQLDQPKFATGLGR